jgi:DNA-binding XRE family transcriptional regulator
MTQEAAVRAGLSRNTAYRLEKGDAGPAVGQVLRYLEAIAPERSLLKFLQADGPALAALEAGKKRERMRRLSKEELNKLDFRKLDGHRKGAPNRQFGGTEEGTRWAGMHWQFMLFQAYY